MSYNAWLYALANPTTHTDPSGMFVCDPMPTCADWIMHALVQLDLSAGVFGDMVFGAFLSLDAAEGADTLHLHFITGDDVSGFGFSLFNDQILLPRALMRESLPPPRASIGLFAHEVIHQTQSPVERASIWGEAQGYMFHGKVIEQLGGRVPVFIRDIILEAHDIGSFGFTTRVRRSLENVRATLLREYPTGWVHLVYSRDLLLPEDLINACQ
jgi:hypothetical protein